MRSGAGPGWREQTGQGVGAGGGGSPALPGPGPHPLAKLPAWAQGTLPGHVSSQSRLCGEPVPSLGLAPCLSRVATLVLKGSLPAVIQPGPVRAVSGKGSPSHPTLSTCPLPQPRPSQLVPSTRTTLQVCMLGPQTSVPCSWGAPSPAVWKCHRPAGPPSRGHSPALLQVFPPGASLYHFSSQEQGREDGFGSGGPRTRRKPEEGWGSRGTGPPGFPFPWLQTQARPSRCGYNDRWGH